MNQKEERSLKFLHNLASSMDKFDYEEILPGLIDHVVGIPIPLILTDKLPDFRPKGFYHLPNELYRACENNHSSPEKSTLNLPWSKVGRLSHVPEDKLEKVKAGRANLPQKAIFYCANDIATACIECLTAGFTKGLSESKTVTLGTWEIKAPLVLAQVAFSLDKLEELKPLAPRIYEERIEFAKSWYQGIIEGFRNQNYPYSLDYAEKLIAFFSNEFGKTKIESGRDYNLSNFYCEYVFNQMFADDPHNVDGILYPSVKFGYKHYNIAIHPRAMSKLSFKSATQVWVTSNGTTDQVNFSFLETAFANGEGNILWNRFK